MSDMPPPPPPSGKKRKQPSDASESTRMASAGPSTSKSTKSESTKGADGLALPKLSRPASPVDRSPTAIAEFDAFYETWTEYPEVASISRTSRGSAHACFQDFTERKFYVIEGSIHNLQDLRNNLGKQFLDNDPLPPPLCKLFRDGEFEFCDDDGGQIESDWENFMIASKQDYLRHTKDIEEKPEDVAADQIVYINLKERKNGQPPWLAVKVKNKTRYLDWDNNCWGIPEVNTPISDIKRCY